MAEAARKRATYEDLFGIPPNHVGEILFGVLYSHPRPAMRHAVASSVLGMRVGNTFHRGGAGGWVIVDEPELHLGPEPDIVVPDIAGWRRERMPKAPDVAAIRLPPDWVCEVLSPSTGGIDRSEKMDIYARESVSHLWLVDPLTKTLEIYHLENSRWSRVATWRGEARVCAEPFESLEINLSALWDED